MAYTYAYPTRRRSLAKLIRLTAGFLLLLAVFVYMVRLLEEGDRLYEGGYSAELVDEAPAAACTAQCSFNGLCGADGACSCDAGFAGPECSAVAPCLCRPLREPPEPLQDFLARFDAERHAAAHAAQVEADLAPWSLRNISAELVDRAEDLGDARLQIVQNRLYARGRLDPPRIRAVTAMLLALLRRVRMPDVDFVVSASDLPAVPRHVPIPVFSAVKSDAHSDILIPDGRAFTEEWAAMVGEYPGEPAWSEKHSHLLWRGAPPGGWSGVEVAASAPEREHVPRARLMKIAEGRAEDIDAGFASHEPQDKSLEKAAATFGPTRPFVPLSDQLKSKLLLSLDGEGAPSSFLPQLASGSLPFKQTSPYYTFYHRWLQPWEHFVPVSPTLDDLPDLIRWSRENDADASAAAAAGARFVRERLRQSDALAYLARALTRYAGMLRYSPRALSGAAPVPQPTAHCPCAASEAEPSEIVRILHAGRVKGFALRAGGPPGSLLRGRGAGALPTPHAPAELAQREEAAEGQAGLFRVHAPAAGGSRDASTPRRVSLESLGVQGHFLRSLGASVVLSPFSRDPWFSEDATWELAPQEEGGGAGGAGGCAGCVWLRPLSGLAAGARLRARPEDGTLEVEAREAAGATLRGPASEYAFLLEPAAPAAAAAAAAPEEPVAAGRDSEPLFRA